MSITTLLVEAATNAPDHGNIALETVVFGIISLVLFAALAFVTFSYRDVANRHSAKAEAYAKRNAAQLEHGAGQSH